MKQFIIKSRMFFLICFMSTVILTLACNAMFPDQMCIRDRSDAFERGKNSDIWRYPEAF